MSNTETIISTEINDIKNNIEILNLNSGSNLNLKNILCNDKNNNNNINDKIEKINDKYNCSYWELNGFVP